MSTANIHPAAPHHLPLFITAPGETDSFLVGAAIFLVVMVLAAGSLYFRLHALPEHLAHRTGSKLQFEVVAVLSLIALFTHNSAFWIAALMLALIPIPNLHGPLVSMAESLGALAGWRRSRESVDGMRPDETGSLPDGGVATAIPPAVHEQGQSGAAAKLAGGAGQTAGSVPDEPDARESPLVPAH